MNQKMTPFLWSALILTATLFGSSFLFIKLTVSDIPPFTLAAGRAALAAVAVYIFMRLNGARLPAIGRDWVPLIVLGILTAVIPYVAIAWGQRYIDSSLGGILFVGDDLDMITIHSRIAQLGSDHVRNFGIAAAA